MKNYLSRFTISQVLMFAAVMALVALMLLTANPAYALLIAPVALTIEEVATEAKSQIKGLEQKQEGLKTDLQSMKNEVDARLKQFGEKDIPESLKAAIDKALETYNGIPESVTALKGVVTDLEQRFAGGNVQNPDEAKSFGAQFIEGAQFKSLLEAGNASNFRGVIRQQVKTVTVANAGGLNNRTARDPEIVRLEQRRLVVRDLMRSVRVNSIAVEYAKQTTRTNNAAPVAEAAAKPYSDYVWTTATVNIRTLAHLAKITRQAMDDAPRLMDEIDQELRYGLGYVEEQQFLYGNNTGQNLNGIIPQATASNYGSTVIALPNRMDVLRLAVLQVVTGSLLPADGIVLHDDDWAAIELSKDSTGNYLFGHPQGSTAPRAWNLPVVVTPAILTGDYLVGNFALGATVYDRMGVEVLISTENVDDFEKNLATVRCEERVAVGVKRPLAFVTGDFATDITAITS